jgi:uncharacterized protein DUF3168
MIQDGIITLLKADPTLSALTTAIVPVGMVKGITSPCIVYHIGTTHDTIDTTGSTAFRQARFQFDAYSAASYKEAKSVAYALRHVLQNYQNSTLADGTFLLACMIDMESDMPFVPQGVQTIEFRVMVQVSVFYKEH